MKIRRLLPTWRQMRLLISRNAEGERKLKDLLGRQSKMEIKRFRWPWMSRKRHEEILREIRERMSMGGPLPGEFATKESELAGEFGAAFSRRQQNLIFDVIEGKRVGADL